MSKTLQQALENQQTSGKDRLTILKTQDQKDGLGIAEKLLYELCDNQTALFGSGGSTPKGLYQSLVQNQKFTVGAFGIVDERYGQPFHAISNEKMMKETGLFDYLHAKNIPVHTMLKKDASREEDAKLYEEEFRDLLMKFPQRIAILGMGVDGHIAGIAPNRPDFTNPLFDHETFVGEFKDPKPMSSDGNPSPPNGFGERITLTFKGLEQMSVLILLAFGNNKQEAFAKMFQEGSESDVPARFLKRADIASKTLLITDQMI